MKKQAEIVLFIKKAVFVGIIFGIIFSPIVLGVVRGSDRSWSAIWLSWTDDPRTSITISWRWDQVRRPYIIIWNETFRKIINITHDGDIFHVNIGGLSPNTKYSYVIGYFNGLDMVNWSSSNMFKTAPQGEVDFTVLVHTDTHSPSYGAFQRFIDVAMKEKFEFIIHCGDMVDRSYEEHWSQFFVNEGKIAKTKPLMVTIGNHEIMYGDRNLWKKYLSTLGGKAWYNFTYSNAMFVSLYVADYYNFSFPEEERELLIEAMRYADDRGMWKILFFHVPILDIFLHHTDPMMAKTLLPLINELKPHLVLMGHDHVYGRVAINDTAYIIIGASGGIPGVGILGGMKPDFCAFESGYLLMKIGRDHINLYYKDLYGKIIDEYTVTR